MEWWSLCGIMANISDCNIVVSKHRIICADFFPFWTYLCILFNTSCMYTLCICNVLCIYMLLSWVFARGPRDWGSISSQVIPKTQKKWYLMPPCLTLSIIRVKWSNPGNGVAPLPTPRCSNYWKGSLWATLD